MAGGVPGGFAGGFAHPLTGPDHFLAMLAVGIWGAQMGGRAVWRLPVAFPLIMAAGGIAGMAGLPLPGVETGIAVSVLVLGLAIAAVWRPADPIPPPYPNPEAARAANGGALPPDLSLITKARAGGADYVYSLMVGYGDPPAGEAPREGLYYNSFFPGHWIAMPPPLSDGQVAYTDGTEATVQQMAEDVATFLTWAGEPTLEERKQTGLKVMLFLIVLTGLTYATMRKVWADAH